MRPWFPPVVLFMTLALWTFPAQAGYISVRLHCVSSMDSDGAHIRVTATNTGDDTAMNVSLTALVGNQSQTAETTPRLSPGGKTSAAFRILPQFVAPGLYAAVVRADFQDTFGYKFSALTWAPFSYGEKTESRVTAEPVRVDMISRGRIVLAVQNADRTAHRVRVRLFVPTELNAPEDERLLTIDGGGAMETIFNMENASARAGADYPVLVFMEYEADNRHYLTVVRNQVHILEDRPFFKEYWAALTAVSLGLFMTALILHFRPYRKGKPGR